MPTPIYQVDAFTAKPFAGNPAAVCFLSGPADDEWMQSVAAEMNLAETAFVSPLADGFELRWFTPAVEVDLCGHATLASAHSLWESGRLALDQQARFHTRSGLLTANRDGDWIVLDFPATPPEQIETADVVASLQEALGCSAEYAGKRSFSYLVQVASETIVRELSPDLSLLSKLPVRGTIVTSHGSNRYDFVSRFFAPGAGINEDPVTGSAHCCLGPFWTERLGKSSFLAYQASARGGEVRVELSGDRVHLGGKAVTVIRGELMQRDRGPSKSSEDPVTEPS